MARTKQTAQRPEKQIYHTQAFTDHAGQSATRVRYSYPDEPIPVDFHAQPVFTFQIYTTIPLDLNEPSPSHNPVPGRMSNDDRTNLVHIIQYVGDMITDRAQRPEPLWELYPEQPGIFECVEHQRREIAHRKANRQDPSVPPIPKVRRTWQFPTNKTGFIIIIDSLGFKVGGMPPWSETGAHGPLWVQFERKFPSKLSWAPQLQEEGTVVLKKVDAIFKRIQSTNDMQYDLSCIYGCSCAPEDPPSSVQEKMDIGWSEDEGTPDAERSAYTGESGSILQGLAARLSLDEFSISGSASTDIVISNAAGTSDPDLRYDIYVPFLDQPGMGDKLEQVANDFTHEVTSRLSGKKTVFFEFHKPSSKTLSSILMEHRQRDRAENSTGALTTFSGKSDNDSDEGPPRVRAYPISRAEHVEYSDPAKAKYEPYRTFIVVLERPDFNQVEGGVLFLLAHGGKFKGDIPLSQAWELDNYEEAEVWRCSGMDAVTSFLEMIW